MKSYPSTDDDIAQFVSANDDIIHKAGPDHVIAHATNANNIRKKLTSTWYGLIFFILFSIVIIVLIVLSILGLATSSMFSKIKVLMIIIMLVVVWLFMFVGF